MLTSAARDLLRSVRTVIVDEVHALAGTKRGAHLALSLERLEALAAESQAPDADGVLRPLQRIGLSATVRPAERVAALPRAAPIRSGSWPRRPRSRGTCRSSSPWRT